MRVLNHGSINHGGQYLAADRRLEPTTYYGPTAGIGLAIAHTRSQGKKVGVIGLGAGTLAVYGQPGDVYRFYEINPQVIELAQSEFTFIGDSKARIEIVHGDARLSLEKENAQGFDVLAVDAFSGDSVPVHLITREAVAIYLRHMNPEGIIAFHVTNTFLSLAPVVQKIASDRGLYSVLIHDDAENSPLRRTDWVLIARDKRALHPEPIRNAASQGKSASSLAVWTDDFNNLLDVLK
ncbi:MAG TPA: fused MFS/spermidine synthase [Nitrosospira sp.]|nr:fused MFS/spermidine synthase [Nitrosospira sp.]